jgi:hypothetical protein
VDASSASLDAPRACAAAFYSQVAGVIMPSGSPVHKKPRMEGELCRVFRRIRSEDAADAGAGGTKALGEASS